MSAKQHVQSFGRTLSAMIMPNIGAFIAWGLITALFIPTGWFPNVALAKMVGPMLTYLLPLLIAYSGGKLIHGTRGGVMGVIVTMGVIVGTSIPMFLGAMACGPFAGWVIKKFDEIAEDYIPSGFEMLVNNFSIGILGSILAVIAYFVVGPIVSYLTNSLGEGVAFLAKHNILPLTSVFVEPAKILFLNNAINHGVFTPVGTQQVKETGKSILFLIEANPGAGLGLLCAYWFAGKGPAKQSAPGAIIIHFLGGIHEIYFPYVLMNPILIIGMICGGIANVTTLVLLHGGLVAPASPGSIFAVLAMVPKGGYFAVISAVVVAAVVSFVVNSILLKTLAKEEKSLDEASKKMSSMKSESKAPRAGVSRANFDFSSVKKIYTACDAGMGSSAMGAGILKKALKAHDLKHIKSGNLAITNLTSDIDIVITHESLTPLARKQLPNAYHVSLTNFMDKSTYEDLMVKLKSSGGKVSANVSADNDDNDDNEEEINAIVLKDSDIKLKGTATTKEEVLQEVAELLIKNNYVGENYKQAILDREKEITTYLGSGIAIPHGVRSAFETIKETGVVAIQYPNGVAWDGTEKAHLIFGIAAKSNEHTLVLQKVAELFDEENLRNSLINTQDVKMFTNFFNGNESENDSNGNTNSKPSKSHSQYDQTITITVKDSAGIHARPAALFSRSASNFTSAIFIEFDGKTAQSDSIGSILSLGIKQNDTIQIHANGSDATQALEALANHFDG